MVYFLKRTSRSYPLFYEFVLKSLHIGHGYIILHTRRKIQIILRKSRTARHFGKRNLRLFFLKRFSRLFFLYHLYSHFYGRRSKLLGRTRKSGMCLSICLNQNPIVSTFKIRNKLADAHVTYNLCFYSPIIISILRLETPIIESLQSKPYYFIPNLTKYPSFKILQ